MSVILNIEDSRWLLHKSEKDWHDDLQALFEKTLSTVSFPNCWINVLLTDSDTIKDINKQHRNIDEPTNVLSFPHYSEEELKKLPDEENILLGDVVMSYNAVNDEAMVFGIPFFERVAHLFVHGVLHTLGYDHVREKDRGQMESLERHILSCFNIEDPYTLREKL